MIYYKYVFDILLMELKFDDVVQGGHFSGIYRKVQLKPLKWVKVSKSNGDGEEERPVEALMVLKYGGVLTHAGRKQVILLPFLFVSCFLPISTILFSSECAMPTVACGH